MTSKDTGKTYCYSSLTARKKGQRMHEAFKHGWVPTGKAASKTSKAGSKAAFKKRK